MLHLRHWKKEENQSRTARSRHCNLCGQPFLASISYRCFCEGCREHNDLLQSDDCLPEAPGEDWEIVEPMMVA